MVDKLRSSPEGNEALQLHLRAAAWGNLPEAGGAVQTKVSVSETNTRVLDPDILVQSGASAITLN